MAAGNFQFALGFATPHFASFAGINPLYPLHRLQRPNPRQRSRLGGALYIDCGVEVVPLGLFLDGVNFSSYTLDYTNLPTSWTAHGSQTISYDDQVGRRKHWRALSIGSFRYFRLTPSGLDAGETIYQVGTLMLATSVLTLSSNLSWPTIDVTTAITDLPYLGGGGEINVEGRPTVELTLSADMFTSPATAQVELGQLLAVPANQPIVVYENLNETQYAYCMQRVDGSVTATERYTTQAVDRITLREYSATAGVTTAGTAIVIGGAGVSAGVSAGDF